jgi:hypothetical protein
MHVTPGSARVSARRLTIPGEKSRDRQSVRAAAPPPAVAPERARVRLPQGPPPRPSHMPLRVHPMAPPPPVETSESGILSSAETVARLTEENARLVREASDLRDQVDRLTAQLGGIADILDRFRPDPP